MEKTWQERILCLPIIRSKADAKRFLSLVVHTAPWEEYDSTYKGQILTQEEYKKIMEVVKEFDDLDYFYEDQLREDDAEAIINDLEEEGVDVSRFKTALERGEPRYEVVIEP